MALGIKPVIFHFPGAESLFEPDLLFRTVAQAMSMIQGGEYRSGEYREYVVEHHSPAVIYSQLETLLLNLVKAQQPQEAVA